MTTKQFTAYFYRVTALVGDKERDLSQLLDKVWTQADRTRYVGEVPIRLQEYKKTRSWCYGDFVRVRMEFLPNKADDKALCEPFELTPDEGMGEMAAFLYNPATKVLVLQSTRVGASTAALRSYFAQDWYSNTVRVNFAPIRNAATTKDLKDMRRAKAFEVEFAPDMMTISGVDQSLASTIQGIQALKAHRATIRVGMGRSRKVGMNERGVLQWVKGLINSDGATKVNLRIEDEEGELRTLQFLDGHLKYSGRLEVGADEKRAPLEARLRILREAWETYGEWLKLNYSLEDA